MDDNRRILVVDDQEDLRQQVARMLEQRSTGSDTGSLIEQIRQRIGRGREPRPRAQAVTYRVDTAGQGQDAYEMVKNSFAAHDPYALMFLDMRMPPGWDGLETAQRIRGIDREIQIVIMTAYADYDQQEISERIGEPDKLLYLKKPFHPEEIRQLALAMTEKWNMSRREKDRLILTNRLMRENSTLTRQTSRDLRETYQATINAFASFLDARGGILVRRVHGTPEVCAATHPEAADRWLRELTDEQRRASHPLTNDRDGAAVLPIAFEGFDGLVVVREKNLIFTFEQLAPFLEILSETAREVVMNAHLRHHQDAERHLDAVSHAANLIADRMDESAERLETLRAKLADGSAEERATLAAELGESNAALQRLSREIHDFHAWRTRAPGRAAHDVGALLGEVLKAATPRLQAGRIALEQQLAPGLMVPCDPQGLRLAFSHLVDNAIDAMERHPSPRPALTVQASRQANGEPHVAIVISDTGGGLPEGLRDRIAEPFVTERPGGTGLGLATARLIVAQHRGSLVWKTDPGTGATFRLYLPLAKP